MPALPEETKSALRKLKIFPRKKMGQNFMIHEGDLSTLAEALSLKEGETVLEIGPGLGFLTKFLLEKKARVIAVEKDPLLAAYLKDHLRYDSLTVVQKDILKFDLAKELSLKSPVKVAGNIPYNITSPILEWLISQKNLIRQAVLTTQWEVAERLTAKPGGKTWGALSIFVQVHSEVEVLKKISRTHFLPAPKVDSAVVKLSFSPVPRFPIENESKFFNLVRQAFQKRRKTILNSLTHKNRGIFSKESVAAALEKTGIDAKRRPETLSIPEWAELSQALP